MTKSLDNRTIFITGSGGVLGTTYVRNMLQAGARIVATDLLGARADALQDSFGENLNFAFYDLDVADEDQVKRFSNAWRLMVICPMWCLTMPQLLARC